MVGVDGTLRAAPPAPEFEEAGLPASGHPLRLVSTAEDRRRLVFTWNRAGVLDQLYFVDLERGQSRLLAIAERFLAAEISPDGRHVAYIPLQRSLAVRGTPRRASLFYSPLHTQGPHVGPVLVASLDAPDQPVAIGECQAVHMEEGHSDCTRTTIAWSPDSRWFAWKDGRGVWASDLSADLPEQVAEHKLEGYVVGHHTYSPAQWSPQGRYLLLDVLHWEGGSYAVTDAFSGGVEHIPESSRGGLQWVATAWLADGRLLVTRHVGSYGEVPPTVSLYTVSPREPGNESNLTLQEIISLPVARYLYADHPIEMADGRIALTLLNLRLQSQAERGVYFLDLTDQAFEQVSELPHRRVPDGIAYSQMVVQPNGSGAIFQDRNDDVLLYLSFAEERLYDLRSHIPSDACCFAWLRMDAAEESPVTPLDGESQ